MSIKPYDSFSTFQAIRLHFTSKGYDAFKYRFKTNVKVSTFEGRNDKYFYGKVGNRFNKMEDLRNYYAAFFVKDITWIGEMINNEQVWTDWQKRNQSLSYMYQGELEDLEMKVDKFNDLFTCGGTTMPLVVSEYLAGNVSIETVVCLNRLTHFMKQANTVMTDPLLWEGVHLKITKYDPFVQADLEKILKITKKTFEI